MRSAVRVKSSMLSCSSSGGIGGVGIVDFGFVEEGEARVEGSMGPRICEGVRFSSRVPGGWMGSYSEVASWPASFKMIFEPPGWESRKSGEEGQLLQVNKVPPGILLDISWGGKKNKNYHTCDVVNYIIDNDPARLAGVMFRDYM